MKFSKDLIKINPQTEVERVCSSLKTTIRAKLRKRGAVVGLSGGVDSSVVVALCVGALGASRVLAVLMPEKESKANSLCFATRLAAQLNIDYVIEDLTPALYGLMSYQRRDEAIRNVFPEFNVGYKTKISLPSNLLDLETLNVFNLTIISPEGEVKTIRLPFVEYLQIVAASNFKQRCRMSMLYYHAERYNYAVIGTSNKNEHDLGFFVKYGDGGSDMMPIAHLFKSQVRQLAEYLDIPEEICLATPTTDTYSAEQTQEEFFFRVPFEILDVIWYGWEHQFSAEEMATVLDLSPVQVRNVIHDIERKISATHYLRMTIPRLF